MSESDEKFVQQLIAIQPRLRVYIYAQLADWAASEDVLQQVSLVMWRKVHEFKEIQNFTAWAYQIASFEVANHRKKRRRDLHLFDDDLVERIGTAAMAKFEAFDVRREALEKCLLALTSEQRDLIKHRYGLESAQSRSIEQIASDQQRNAGAIRQALYKIRMSLMDCIERRMVSGGRP